MPWPVYSERVLNISSPATEAHYVVPVGRRLVIKHVVFISTNGTAATMQLNTGGRVSLWHVFQAAVPMVMWPVHLVVYGGEYASIFTTGSSVGASVCGFLFAEQPGLRETPPAGQQLPAAPGPAIPMEPIA